MKKTILFIIVTITLLFASCMPYINTSLSVRQHIKTDKFWLGYLEPLLSNKLLDVTTVEELGTDDSDGNPTYTIYLATEKGMQTSADEGETWTNLKYGESEILGVADIYDDAAHSRIFISSESGLYYKYYGEADIRKVENSALKKVDLTNKDFRDPTKQTKTSEDIDGYSIAVYGDIVFIATSTGLYFSTDFPTVTTGDHNGATWGNIIGKTILTMDKKGLDYPQTTLDADEMDYDPIYDPIENPTYNPNPDFYAWDKVTFAGKVAGDPITIAEYVAQGKDTTTPSADMDEQQAMRLIYETEREIHDYGNPNYEEDGVIRKFAYYRDMRLKATRIKDIAIYDDVIYLATHGGGVSFANIKYYIDGAGNPVDIDSSNPATYDHAFVWETYMRNYFQYPTIIKNISSPRGAENSWSLGSEYGLCIAVDSKGVFYGAQNAGIGLASTYKSEVDVLDIDGFRADMGGHKEYKLTSDGTYKLYNNSFFPQVAIDAGATTKEEIANCYFRADRDPNDSISNEYLLRGLRLNWKEFTDRGYSRYTAPGDIPPYQAPVRKFPNNTIRKIRFGSLGLKQLIYIATNCGMGVAEVKKSFSFNDNTKLPAKIVGDAQYEVGFYDWGEYHKDLTQAGEQIFVTDLAITKDKDGNDKYIYAATAGQGLVRFKWVSYEQNPYNLTIDEIKY